MDGNNEEYQAGFIAGIRYVELSLMRKLEHRDVRTSDDEWNDVITALTQIRTLFASELQNQTKP